MDEKKEIKPGLHFAKSRGSKWFNAIINVYGESPFFKVDGWDYANDRRIIDIAELDEVGDFIKRP